ncbi:DUF711 family protein [Testudinibacter sp. P80/BLE/0925]|uniref:DUF711 family protein n=1 Tax=Testudinibacter sp. TW-1 TaxID=3417757 RepID=UPI003D35A187
MPLSSTALCRVRAITAFTSLSADSNTWQTALAAAKKQCDSLAHALQRHGYQVQSIRIVTNPFAEYLNLSSLQTAKQGLAAIKAILLPLNQGSDRRIRFAIGEAKTQAEIELLPELIKDYGDLCNACVNIAADEFGFLDNRQISQCAAAVQKIAAITPRGEGNFNFTVNFNCQPLIPYFPASYHRSELGNCFVIGLETPDLLAAVLEGIQSVRKQQSHAAFLQLAYRTLRGALQYHIDQVNECIAQAEIDSGWRFAGMDTSAAPSKNCHSMVDIYRLLGVPYFGAAGTVEASALLTRVFKTLDNVDAVGFSGLMLAVTEDQGLAEATRQQQFDIRALLTYSSVCGIGLDTVPIEGDTPLEKITAIMRDTGTMAFRLNKPLTVRLFPVPNLSAGQHTRFESEDLCNCAVLAVP